VWERSESGRHVYIYSLKSADNLADNLKADASNFFGRSGSHVHISFDKKIQVAGTTPRATWAIRSVIVTLCHNEDRLKVIDMELKDTRNSETGQGGWHYVSNGPRLEEMMTAERLQSAAEHWNILVGQHLGEPVMFTTWWRQLLDSNYLSSAVLASLTQLCKGADQVLDAFTGGTWLKVNVQDE
jgi:hypothetical protein